MSNQNFLTDISQLSNSLNGQQTIESQHQQIALANAQRLARIQILMGKKDDFERSSALKTFRYEYGYGAFRVSELHDMENGLPVLPIEPHLRPPIDQLHSIKYPGDDFLTARTIPAFAAIKSKLFGRGDYSPITQGFTLDECEYILKTDLKQTFVNARMRMIGIDELFEDVIIVNPIVGIMSGFRSRERASMKSYGKNCGECTVVYNYSDFHPYTRARLQGIDYLASFMNSDRLKATYGIQNILPQGIRVKYSLE